VVCNMSDWASQEEAEEEKTDKQEVYPSDWEDEQNVDAEQWKNQAQQEMDREADPDNNNNDNDNNNPFATATATNETQDKQQQQSRARSVSKHYNLESTEPLREKDALWILIKSVCLWLYLLCLSIGVLNYDWPSPETIWLLAYCVLFLFWCCFFKRTASCSLGGFYPFIGATWKHKTLHCAALLFGFGGIDLYYLERRRCVMRECLMQYKVLECSILSFAYFMSLFVRYPWSDAIDEHYEHWSTHFAAEQWIELLHSLPVLLLLMDALVHYSKVYHWQLYWCHYNGVSFALRYALITAILCVDQFVRSLLLLLMVRVAAWCVLLCLAAYVALCIALWSYALQQHMQGFKLMLRKSGGKLVQAILFCTLSVGGMFELMPSIKSAASDIQGQQRRQQKWGKNVIRCECGVRLLCSVVVFTKYWVMRNWRFPFEQKFVIYGVLVAFALYPYLMECLFQTPLSALCRGSFFVLHHIDNLTSLPNLHRLQKDLMLRARKKRRINTVVIVNVCGLRTLNAKFGAQCGDRTLIRVMQRVLFEMEEEERRVKLYRGKSDRFVMVATSFEDKERLEQFVRALVAIQITVQRPSDFDREKNAKNGAAAHKKNDDADDDEMNGKDDPMSGGETTDGGLDFDDDFINPNKDSLYAGGGDGGGGGGGNWFDDDEADADANKTGDAKTGDATTGKKSKKKRRTRRRGNSSYNKATADESLTMCVRVSASFGVFATLAHAMSLDHELKVDEKNGRIHDVEDRFKIVELNEPFK